MIGRLDACSQVEALGAVRSVVATCTVTSGGFDALDRLGRLINRHAY